MEAWTDEWNLAKRRKPPAEPQGERAGHGSIKARDGWLGGCGSPISPDVRRPYWDFLGAVKLRLGGVCKVDDN